MKLHITETEEASPNQGDAEDYGYGLTRTNHVQALAPQVLDLERVPGSGKRKSPRRGFDNDVRGIGWWA